jgi:hypothetical protein
MQPGAIEDAPTARRVLCNAWELCGARAGESADPASLEREHRNCGAAVVEAVGQSLRAACLWTLDGMERRFDAEDWWYRRFDVAGTMSCLYATSDASLGLCACALLDARGHIQKLVDLRA